MWTDMNNEDGKKRIAGIFMSDPKLRYALDR